MKSKIIALIIGVALLSSCAGIRGGISMISEENKLNFKLADKLVVDLHEIWPYMSGMYEASKDSLPPDLIKRARKVDKIMLKKDKTPVDISTMSKRDKGEVGTHFIILTGKSAKQIYEQFAPDIFTLLGLLGL
ncbi:hypothetical protein LCGC14_2800700 [marine sediment metagenome]|uniref:Uncharacterized protein n=1 Tax=marine sediment metagenome TaxID=412755 RepID=A0A0F8YMV4_9ZZZZ